MFINFSIPIFLSAWIKNKQKNVIGVNVMYIEWRVICYFINFDTRSGSCIHIFERPASDI